MMRHPNTPLFMMLLVASASLFPAEAYSQQVEAAGRGSRPVHPGNVNAGLGMNYWAGDWGSAGIRRWGASAWASTPIWHCLGINAEGHSMIVGGNRIASNYKLFVGEGGLVCTVRAWDRFQPIYKGGLGFASLTQPGDGRGKFHSTYSIWSFGAGVDIHTRGRWWTRVEYTYEGIPNFYSGITHKYHTLNPKGISFGMTYHFGGGPKTSFPEPVAVDQETQNLPGPYTANQRSVTKPNAPAPDTATGTPVAKIPENATSQFKLGTNDVIHVDVWEETELSQTATIGPDGFISLPLVGSIYVVGMTPVEVAQALRAKLTQYIVKPLVTVNVVAIHSRQVYIMGYVAKPGNYPLVGPINVLQLIAMAGGLTPYANRERITILRGTEKIRFNYNSLVRGDEKQNVLLQPGDTVLVP